MVIPFLSRLYFNFEFILRRRQRTGRERRESTWRIFGLVEVENGFAVDRFIRMEKASSLVGIGLIRTIMKDNEQRSIIILDWLERAVLSFQIEFQHARAFHLEETPHYIWNHYFLCFR